GGLDAALGRIMAVVAPEPHVNDVQHVELEIAQIVVNRLSQFFRRSCGKPGSVLATTGADLGDDDEIVGVGRQRLADQLVDDIWAVIVAGVDMVDAERYGFSQHRSGLCLAPGPTADAGTGHANSHTVVTMSGVPVWT